MPGRLGIASQAHRGREPDGQYDQAYSLADAMRDAIWRKNTAARPHVSDHIAERLRRGPHQGEPLDRRGRQLLGSRPA